MDSMLFDAIADSDANGLVIKLLGQGIYRQRTLPGLQRCLIKEFQSFSYPVHLTV